MNSNSKFLYFYEKFMNIMGPCGNLMFFFQAYKIFSCKSAASISLPGFIISLIGLSSWLFYGILIKNTPIIATNLVGVVGAILVLIGAVLY